MEKLEKIGINDLTERMQTSPIYINGLDGSKVLNISDTVWGLKDGIFVPLGEICLPIQYAYGDYEWGREMQICTLFRSDFFGGIAPVSKETPGCFSAGVSRPYCDGYIETPKYYTPDVKGSVSISNISTGGKPARPFVLNHIQECLRLYLKRQEIKDDDAKQCVTRSFIPYS